MSYILAFDVGTTAVKAVLVDWETGEMQYAKADCLLMQPKAGWAEQDADQMWEAVCQASVACIEKAAVDVCKIVGMVISAPWRHAILLDADHKPLRNSIIWMDGRAGAQAEKLNRLVGSFVNGANGYWARLLWLKEMETDLWEKARYVSGLNAYFKYRATGVLTTECSDDFIHSPNSKIQEYFNKVLTASGLMEDVHKFPPMRKCTDCVGHLTEDASKALGLWKGMPVFGGFGDLPAVYFGSGCMEEGTAHIYIGTSSWFGELMPERVENYSPSHFTADHTHEGALFGLTTGGRAHDWSIDRFYSGEKEELGDGVFELVDKEIEAIPAGSDGLIVTHWLNGEARPLARNARAVFFNVTELHDRRHFVRAMLESICYSHRRALEKYVEFHGRLPKRIHVVGGGAGSPVWMQMLADILKVPIHVPANPRYVGTVGSCQCALIGLGIERDFSGLGKGAGGRTYEPQKENEAVYDKMYGIYKKLYPALQPLYDEMNGIY